MHRRQFFSQAAGSLALPFALSCGQGSPAPAVPGIVDTPEQREAYLETLLDRICVDIGPHPSGTPEYDRVTALLRDEMSRSLSDVRMQEFFFQNWKLLEPAELVIDGKKMETFAAHGCYGTSRGGEEGYLVRTDDERVPFAVFDPAEQEYSAYITINDHGGAIPIYAAIEGLQRIATFNVGREDRQFLAEAADRKAHVFINVQMLFHNGVPASNVIGTIPGKSEREMLFIAHADTVYASPGANDNTASVIVMLMLAHAFSGWRPEFTIRFLATGCEEYGFIGARRYAAMRESEGTMKNIRILVNFDSLTYGPNLQITTLDRELSGIIEDIHTMPGIIGKPHITVAHGFKLDNIPFRKSGASAVYVNSRGYDERTLHLWHRPEDLPATVPRDCVENSFLVFSECIRRAQGLS